MGATATKEVKNQLPDGRLMRPLEGTYNQKAMFTLKNGVYAPNEGIMSVKETDQAIQTGVYASINVNGWNRTDDVAFYRKGFQKKDIPLGDKIVYVESGVAYTLNIPDIPVKLANGETVGLRKAIGMGVIKLRKLDLKQEDEKAFTVSVSSDFDPSDARLVDIMRPDGWALVDQYGYPLRSKPSRSEAPDARYSYLRDVKQFDEASTGWFGSVARNVYGRVVYADDVWSGVSGVALVGAAEGSAPRDVAVEIARPVGNGAFRSSEVPVATVCVSGAVILAAKAEIAAMAEHGDVNMTKLTAVRQLLDSLEIKE